MASLCLVRFSKEVLRPSNLIRGSLRTACFPIQQTKVEYCVWHNGDLLQTGSTSQIISSRNAGFFTRLTADELWSGVTGVSNQGKKRGRGRNVRGRIVDLNRGQRLGDGRVPMVWPGLNVAPTKGSEYQKLRELAPNPKREEQLLAARVKMNKGRYKISSLERGWSGSRFPGMSIGPPDPINDYTFEGFDSRVLEYKMVANVTGNMGKRMRASVMVVTGNGNGLAGFAVAKAPLGRTAIRKAKNRAAQRLLYIERYNNHTVYHNMYNKEQQTALYIEKAAAGAGLRCHRVIKTICEVIGIKDLKVKVEGSSRNYQNITKALFDALRNQETHQDLADRLKLNVVEYQNNMENVPIVVARPATGTLTKDQKPQDENLDFDNLYYNGRVPYKKPKKVPFFQKQKPYKKRWFQLYKSRNQEDARRERCVLGIEPSAKELSKRSLPLK
ncbi:hypothetical protein SNE40_011031 [Patella caerulea]|uniref:Small ribosomal subunit protein uS5m n=1 Tax=Patella caerulea TaxID=87958 RepID=A0AAN8JVU5_PATCE